MQQPPPSPPPPSTHLDPAKDRRDSPRELRRKAEKQRRDTMTKLVAQLAAIVPPVVAARRKLDRTSVLRLTAHYLRSHQHVFGDAVNSPHQFSGHATLALLGMLKGFVLTTTYKGLVVVVSHNVQEYLGYEELDFMGQSIFNFIHEDDKQMLRCQLMPKSDLLGPNGELLIPDEPNGVKKVEEALQNDKRSFVIRFKKYGLRTMPQLYVNCHVEGTFRKADKACGRTGNYPYIGRRIRMRGNNIFMGGNDVVFVGMVRPTCETFANERKLESFRMEYRTRHSVDGEIMDCDSRIALVTGYMTHEVRGLNAMNFMHKDDVRWVVVALREMYDQKRLVGESCYRLMAKNGQFIYLRTRGYLEVEENTRAVTSFVCTNTMVDEDVGKHLIKLMKKKFMILINNNQETTDGDEEDESLDTSDPQSVTVEDPRLVEKVILHLVTNLPSTQTVTPQSPCSTPGITSPPAINIIPPKKERTVNAIEKIYNIITTFKKQPTSNMERENNSNILTRSSSSSECESDWLSSLSSSQFNSSDPESLPSISSAQTRNLKRKHDDDDNEVSVKICRTGDHADAAVTASTSRSQQSVNTIRGSEGFNMCWPPLELGPSHQPSLLETILAQETEADETYTSFHLDYLERFDTDQFRDNDESYSYMYGNQGAAEILHLPHVPSGRTCTVTNPINVTTDSNSYQQYRDPARQQGQSYFNNNSSTDSYSPHSPIGFTLSDFSDTYNLSPNVPEPMRIDPASSSSSSYLMDGHFQYDQNFQSTSNFDFKSFTHTPSQLPDVSQSDDTSLGISNAVYATVRDEISAIDISIYEVNVKDKTFDTKEHDDDHNSSRRNQDEIGDDAENISESQEINDENLLE